jgi:hypothetical protein
MATKKELGARIRLLEKENARLRETQFPDLSKREPDWIIKVKPRFG